MNFKSAYVVLAVGIIFVISAIFRLFGFLVPSLVVALISVIAALISLSDVVEITRFKKYGGIIQIVALVLFIFSMTIWLFPINLKSDIVQAIGDSFTILGLGFVIGLFGFKEILDQRREKNIEKPNEKIENYKFRITLNEYEEMMRLNDIIVRLTKLDQDIFPFNKVHNGWALFSDSLSEHWNRWGGPFYDGMNRKKYYEFLLVLDRVAEKIGNVADADDYRTIRHTKVEMWGELLEITIQPRINNRYLDSMNDLTEEIHKALLLWDEFKDLVNKRYEKERSEQRK
ncbi:hypothetical protein BABA_00735 [Neobacillus bataviensis LMG 21833]|uniref:Uncharacterized protein n=1 Tax=Neobacillus bataviensis LMG 21833 TaxID=1117379 RepID=K6DGA0_9BACI|nr:APC family permease [Neobacillus bataviensis]EKN71592.1 hypothetical protein BABA_00735 [Neobacillus bataviensis LMG 21833]